MSAKNWLWFGLSLQHCVNVAGIFSGSCEICSWLLLWKYGFFWVWNGSCHWVKEKKEQIIFLSLGIPSELAKHPATQDCGAHRTQLIGDMPLLELLNEAFKMYLSSFSQPGLTYILCCCCWRQLRNFYGIISIVCGTCFPFMLYLEMLTIWDSVCCRTSRVWEYLCFNVYLVADTGICSNLSKCEPTLMFWTVCNHVKVCV